MLAPRHDVSRLNQYQGFRMGARKKTFISSVNNTNNLFVNNFDFLRRTRGNKKKKIPAKETNKFLCYESNA